MPLHPSQLRQFLSIYERWAKSLCAPVFWRGTDQKYRNGTMTFLRTDSAVLGVTNAHVADGLAGCTAELGKRCQIGGASLDPSNLIARHPSLDLATFLLSDIVLAQVAFLSDFSLGTEHHEAATVSDWPPRVPSEGDPVMYGGYPAIC